MIFVSTADPYLTVDAVQLQRPLEVSGPGPHPAGLTMAGAGDWLVTDGDGQRFVSSHNFEALYVSPSASPLDNSGAPVAPEPPPVEITVESAPAASEVAPE